MLCFTESTHWSLTSAESNRKYTQIFACKKERKEKKKEIKREESSGKGERKD